MAGQKGRDGSRCSAAADSGPAPSSAPSVRRGKGLLQVHVDDIEAHSPGLTLPRMALRLAPSWYSKPPAACTMSRDLEKFSSNTPRVEGFAGAFETRGLRTNGRTQCREVHVPSVSVGISRTAKPRRAFGAGLVPSAGRRHDDLATCAIAHAGRKCAESWPRHGAHLARRPIGVRPTAAMPVTSLSILLEFEQAATEPLPGPLGCQRMAGADHKLRQRRGRVAGARDCTPWCRSRADGMRVESGISAATNAV